jgi:outer membrane protein assembly factor BamB
MTMMSLTRHIGPVIALAVSVLAASPPDAATVDWPQWRGPNRDGRSAETGLLQTWPAGGPPLAWKVSGAGIGFSSMSAVGPRLFTMGARGRVEYVMAFDRATGKKLWEARSGDLYDNDRGSGPRGTPTFSGGRLYALGASGDLTCLDPETGRVHWAVNLLRTFGGSNPRWGLSESPLVTNGRVLVNAGGPGASIVALDARSGSVVWKSGNDGAGYSSAVLQRVGSIEQAVFFTASGARGVDVRDGRLLWEYAPVANRVANAATPVVSGPHVFLSSDYGTAAALLRMEASGTGITAQEVYFTRDMRNHHSSSVLDGDHLYGFSSAILTALRLADGEVAWRDRSVGKGSVVYADKRLYLLSENGVVGLADASPDAYRERGRFSIPAGQLSTWAHPIVAGGHLYLRDQDTLYAYDVRQKR